MIAFNVNIISEEKIISPSELKRDLPLPLELENMILKSRMEIADAISGKDKRPVVIIGPCSIHDPESALEYAKRVAEMREKYGDKIIIIMRVYFEKPRTTVGWKGLIYDPKLDESDEIVEGLHIARKLMLDISKLGVPIATEFLGPLIPPYISDLVSWGAIGARTIESQTHREMVSGLSMPVGLKNSTDGSYDNAINAMLSSKEGHSFLGINKEGHIAKITTKGNPDSHLILRGGSNGPNYDENSVKEAVEKMSSKNISSRLLIDCSHANSGKDHKNQPGVCREVMRMISQGLPILGVMIESHLEEGAQKLGKDLASLKSGQSITDACIGWEETEKIISEFAEIY